MSAGSVALLIWFVPVGVAAIVLATMLGYMTPDGFNKRFDISVRNEAEVIACGMGMVFWPLILATLVLMSPYFAGMLFRKIETKTHTSIPGVKVTSE